MTDAPKMLTAEELDEIGASAISLTSRQLLDHIAAQAARIAALEKAGDAVAAPFADGDYRCCEICGCSWSADGSASVPEEHDEECPVPAWRAVRENADG